jgi:hypothetical protein
MLGEDGVIYERRERSVRDGMKGSFVDFSKVLVLLMWRVLSWEKGCANEKMRFLKLRSLLFLIRVAKGRGRGNQG